MIVKVDKILLDSPLAAGMIGGVTIADLVLAGNSETAFATARSKAQSRFGSLSLGWMTST